MGLFLQWMYPVECYIKVLKGYRKNQYQPKASIVERYVAKEAIEFCSEYIETASPLRLPQIRHDYTQGSRGTRGYNVVTMDHQQVSLTHLYILNNKLEYSIHRYSKTKYVSYSP